MKKTGKQISNSDVMRPEYDFSGGVRGKHAAKFAAGTNLVLLDPDVASEFANAKEVNDTLRAVLQLTRRRNGRKKKSA